MKITKLYFFPILLLIINFNTHAQSLKNTDWVRIKAERKDGSRLIDRSARWSTEPLTFSFKDTTITFSYDGEYTNTYTLDKDVLSIGIVAENNVFLPTEKYQIDSLSNLILTLSEIPKTNQDDKETNKYTFIRSRYYLQYLLSGSKITLSNDTIIECNKYLFPYFKGNIEVFLTQKLVPLKNSGAIRGSFLISPLGEISQVNIDSTISISPEQLNEFKGVLLETNGQWKKPIPSMKHYYRMNFIASYYWPGSLEKFLSKVSIIYNTTDTINFPIAPLSPQQISKLNQFYNRGTKMLNQNKFQSAITEFEKCLEIDSFSINSYHNKAYAHYKLGEIRLACESWKKLKDLDQVDGTKLYQENCQ